MIPVVICGEGRNELGSLAGDPVYQTDAYPGFIEASLARVSPGKFRVVRPGVAWKHAPVLRVGAHHGGNPYIRKIRGLVQRAHEHGAHLCLLVDQDGHPSVERWIRAGVDEAREWRPETRVAAGAPAPELEGWVLALLGAHGTEELTPAAAERHLANRGVDAKDTAAFVAAVEHADLERLPTDAQGLRRWFSDLRQLFGE